MEQDPSKEKRNKSIVAFMEGKESGIRWVRGYNLEIDPTTERVVAVEPVGAEWTDRDLSRDAVQISSVGANDEELPPPKIGDPAPTGWREWRG